MNFRQAIWELERYAMRHTITFIRVSLLYTDSGVETNILFKFPLVER